MVARQGEAAASRKGAAAEQWKQHSHNGNDCHSKGTTRLINQPAAITIVTTTASGNCHGMGPQCSDAAKTTMAKASSGCSIATVTAIKNDIINKKQQSNGKQQR